ncbi:hypothetical protein AAFF39_03335 [Lactococcus garvieae]
MKNTPQQKVTANVSEDINTQTFKALRFKVEGSNVNAIEAGLVRSVRVVERRSTEKNDSGEYKAITGSCAKLVIEVYDSVLVDILTANNANYKSLECYTVEVEADEDYLLSIDTEKLKGKKISLKEAMLAPKWVVKGRSGSYSSLKLVIDRIEFVSSGGTV